ncbi:uncharacterized protein LY89DRAFT_726327 [Mollisia scopiformis]|uniref:Uncharacterized protein n=1 Tax=Mollisia scopiformis TaxID=149040 RepID=A0A132B2M5_MOLSC|nr:uncharacterized protein LY89DRAFT_726327 [Mollisia scopiformis]KUJ06650.1 hypothetical protein LY89DRAFT_726327 [Mollisia scopiformis]
MVGYNYGPWALVNETTGDSVANYTFVLPSLEAQYSYLGLGTGSMDSANQGLSYRLSGAESVTYQGQVFAPGSSFILITQLLRSDGDVSIILLAGNGVIFYDEMDDDWYRATRYAATLTDTELPSAVSNGYIPVEAGSPMGCLERFQWCSSGKCGPLASFYHSVSGTASIFNMTAEDFSLNYTARPSSTSKLGSVFVWIYLMLAESGADINMIAAGLPGAQVLTSESLLINSIQYPLPLNQWQLDVSYWFDIILATFQAIFVDVASGPSDPMLEQSEFEWSPENEQERQLCNSQKVQSTSYASFSLFGLLFTYILSILIISVSFILDPILTCLQHRRKYKTYARLEWNTNATLQLHRLTQEELGLGNWEGCADMVPTTKAGEMLAGLDINDLDHPVLIKPTSTEKEKRSIGTEEISDASTNEILIPKHPVSSIAHHVEDVDFDGTTGYGESRVFAQGSRTGQDDVRNLSQTHTLEFVRAQVSRPGANDTLASPQGGVEEFGHKENIDSDRAQNDYTETAVPIPGATGL